MALRIACTPSSAGLFSERGGAGFVSFLFLGRAICVRVSLELVSWLLAEARERPPNIVVDDDDMDELLVLPLGLGTSVVSGTGAV